MVSDAGTSDMNGGTKIIHASIPKKGNRKARVIARARLIDKIGTKRI